MAIIGLDIGGTKILGALFDDVGHIIDRNKELSKGNKGFDTMMGQIHFVIDELLSRNTVTLEGIGVGVPGVIDEDGVIGFTPNLPIKQFNLRTYLEEAYQVPVVIGNDVNLGVYGEYSELGIEYKNVIGVFPGTGLGGGIIINKTLFTGQGAAGELGHMVVEKDGVKCGCGNHGCLESYASKKGLLSYMKTQIKKGRKTLMKQSVKSGLIKSSELKKAYDKEDEVTVEAMERFNEYLGVGLGSIINIFNPDLIIIGGGIIEAFGKKLLRDIKKQTRKHTMKGLYQKTKIKQSKLDDDAVVFGAYHLAKNTL